MNASKRSLWRCYCYPHLLKLHGGYMPSSRENIRLLTSEDCPLIERLLRTSEYIYQRFTLDELSLLLKHYPCVGFFHGSSLHGFLLTQSVNPPTAWIGGFGVSWT